MTPGSGKTIQVSLYGGLSDDLENFSWRVDDPLIAEISTARNNCVITASRTGSTQIIASHPKAAFDYSIVLYVYTDSFSECFLTTQQNVVTINRSEINSRTLAIDIVNPVSVLNPADFNYEVITQNENTPCVNLIPNGNTVVVNALSDGVNKIRVTYNKARYPLDIIIRVTAVINHVYITPSETTVIIDGSGAPRSVYANITGFTGFVNPDAFNWEVLDVQGYTAREIMEWQTAGNSFTIQGKKNGAAKVRITHELSEYPRVILIILNRQAGSAIDASMYITTSQNYVQTKIGDDPLEINVTLQGGVPGDEHDFEWAVDNGVDNDICLVETTTGYLVSRAAATLSFGNIHITPRNIGQTTITVSHPKALYSTDIIIKVYSRYALLEEPAVINTERSLIKILNGGNETVAASLSGNVQAGDENAIQWESASPFVINASPSSGPNIVLSALGTGSRQTYINITHEKALSPKRILVLSADTQELLDAMKGVYADTTYFRINEDSEITVSINQFGMEASDINQISWTTNNPAVASAAVNPMNRLEAVITGIAMGEAVISAQAQNGEACLLYVTVLPIGEDTELIRPKYLTTNKNAAVLPVIGDTANLSIQGVNISEYELLSTLWSASSDSVISISANGKDASITALAAGRADITISNPYSSNTLTISVKVGALYEWNESFIVYITTDEDTLTIVKGQQRTIGARLENSSNQTGFSFAVTGAENKIDITGANNGTCLINALNSGATELTIYNAQAAAEKTILVLIANTEAELAGLKYLTTNQNVVTVGESFNVSVTVSVQGAANPVLSGYNWSSSDPALIDVVSSGQTAVFYGKRQGTAKITITNDSCEYPLEIIANCVDPVLAAANPYIFSQNIITLYAGDSPTAVSAELIGGVPADNSFFSWQSLDSTIASCLYANNTAQLRALKTGVTQIVISHPKAQGVNRTILVICEPAVSNEYYITTTESIIRMSPTDSDKTITASLVNGTAGDAYAFNFWADSYDIIDLNFTQNQAVIRPLSTGNTTIHISHPKAAYQKDIIIYISAYSEFAFETTSKSVTAGTQSFVNMRVPVSGVSTNTSYTAKYTDGTSASDILSVGGTKNVCILSPNAEGSCVVTANLIAVNSGAVLGTAELLVSIAPSANAGPYINYSGSTIITMEKNVTRTLNAVLAGPGTNAQDAYSLQWKWESASNPNGIILQPASASGTAVNNEVQITAVQAGVEGTITITHEKCPSKPVILYIIVPGTDGASITLNKTALYIFLGESPQAITAAITNAATDDYNNIIWTLTQHQQNEAVEITGTGKNINILPKSLGSATLKAQVPSTMRFAECEIFVEQQRSIVFEKTTINTYPGQQFEIIYSTTPESETANVQWTISDASYVQIASDNHAGTLTLITRRREGAATITGRTASGATAVFTVINGWGNSLVLSKNYIKSIPVDSLDGTFDVSFEMKPSCAEIRVSNLKTAELRAGTYSSRTGTAGNYVYTILPAMMTINPDTGAAEGVIRIKPNGERSNAQSGNVIIQAYNPIANQAPGGEITGAVAASSALGLDIYYSSYPVIGTVQTVGGGKHSRYDSGSGIVVLGDGETLDAGFAASISGVTLQIVAGSVIYTALNTSERNNISSSAITGNKIRLTHSLDYNDAAQNAYTTDDTVIQILLAGKISMRYRTYDNAEHTVEIPVYFEKRACQSNYSH